MALTKQQKAKQLAELKEKLSRTQSVIFTSYIGLKVGEVSTLRRKLKDAGAEMKVAKKSLMGLAAKEHGAPALPEEMMAGPIACIFSYQDPLAGAQIAFTFAKDHPQVAFMGGLFEGKILSQSDAKALAQIPGRQVLLSQFAGMLRSPLQQFAGICASPLSGFARALAEIARKKAS